MTEEQEVFFQKQMRANYDRMDQDVRTIERLTQQNWHLRIFSFVMLIGMIIMAIAAVAKANP